MFEEAELLELFQRTLACDYDDDGAWEAVNALRASGSRQVFDRAAEWLRSENPLERARAADILGQIGVGPGKKHAFPAEACDLLLTLLRSRMRAPPRPRSSRSAISKTRAPCPPSTDSSRMRIRCCAMPSLSRSAASRRTPPPFPASWC
jgi:hypothetical protein